MKNTIIVLLATALIGSWLGFITLNHKQFRTEQQHIKVQRVGCHQYRINEFTNEVQHLEGCNSPEHLTNETN